MGVIEQSDDSGTFPASETRLFNDETKKLSSDQSSSDESSEDLKEILSDPDAVKKEKKNIMKNLLLICFAFLCNFIAFGGAASLQSSLNVDQGMGTITLAILYAALILSAMFTPTIVISKLGCKWTICLSIMSYTSYCFANFYPCWGTLVPSSIMVGLSAAPLWSAKSAYLTTAAKRYARLNKETIDAVVNRFFGIFFLFFQFNNIVGQLISSLVLSSGNSVNLEFPSCYNETYIEQYCGSNDDQENLTAARLMYNSSECPINNLQSEKIPRYLIYTLMGIYAGIALLGAAVVGVFVDSIVIRANETRSPFALLIATFRHMKDYRQILLIPITMFSGFEQAFLTGDITRSFVTCPLAVNWVGFVLICYGACDSFFSLVFGRLEKHTGRIPLFSLAFVINVVLIIVFLLWIPYPSAPLLFFLLPAFWGIADAVWQTQLNALYGVLFVANQEACFANFRLWQSLGFVIAFGYQSAISVSAKLYVLISVLIIGMLLYYFIEYKTRRRKSRSGDLPVKMELEDNDEYLQSNNSFTEEKKKISEL